MDQDSGQDWLDHTIVEALAEQPAWEPPAGFSRRVAMQVQVELSEANTAGQTLRLSPSLVPAASFGITLAAVVYGAARLFVSLVPLDALAADPARLAWVSIGGALLVSACFTRRALA